MRGLVFAALLAALGPSAALAQATSTSPRAEADPFTLRPPVPFALSVATATQSKGNATGSGHALRLAQGERSRALEASGQAYPAKPIRFVVPFPPGGGNDTIARLIAQKLSAALGQQVIVDNRPGAGGTIGAEAAARAPADGYNMFLAGVATHGINPSLRKKLPYDALKDFEAVSLIASAPLLLVVHPSLPAKSVKDLVALAKAQPGKINYASTGPGARRISRWSSST